MSQCVKEIYHHERAGLTGYIRSLLRITRSRWGGQEWWNSGPSMFTSNHSIPRDQSLSWMTVPVTCLPSTVMSTLKVLVYHSCLVACQFNFFAFFCLSYLNITCTFHVCTIYIFHERRHRCNIFTFHNIYTSCNFYTLRTECLHLPDA